MKVKPLTIAIFLSFIPFVSGSAMTYSEPLDTEESYGAAAVADDPAEKARRLFLAAQSEDIAYQQTLSQLFAERQAKLISRMDSFCALKAEYQRRLDNIGKNDIAQHEREVAAVLEAEHEPATGSSLLALLDRKKEEFEARNAVQVAKISGAIEALEAAIRKAREEASRLSY